MPNLIQDGVLTLWSFWLHAMPSKQNKVMEPSHGWWERSVESGFEELALPTFTQYFAAEHSLDEEQLRSVA